MPIRCSLPIVLTGFVGFGGGGQKFRSFRVLCSVSSAVTGAMPPSCFFPFRVASALLLRPAFFNLIFNIYLFHI